jgi:hypothetical protein
VRITEVREKALEPHRNGKAPPTVVPMNIPPHMKVFIFMRVEYHRAHP